MESKENNLKQENMEAPYQKLRGNKISVYGDDLNNQNIYSYGIGHFMNDMCASTWFFYFSYYLIQIVGLNKDYSTYVILSGQVFDGLATPLVGIFSDKTNTRFGKRSPWYFFGTLLVAVTFSLIFFSVMPPDASEFEKMIYYSVCASVFNIGWATVQVSHMALLPLITLSKKKKDKMTRIRTGFTFLAQTLTLLLSFVYFYLITDKILQYQLLAGTSIAIGLILSGIFMCLCKEHVLVKNINKYYENIKDVLTKENLINSPTPSLNNKERSSNTESNNDSEKEEEITWVYWLKKSDFYFYIVVYMLIRLSINITSTIVPFYMQIVLGYELTKDGGTPYPITLCLLLSTIGSIANSLFFEKIIEKNSKKEYQRIILLFSAFIFVAIGCLPVYFLSKELRYPIFILSFIWGIGFSQALSCVSTLINDVVGSKGNKGAFVYGAFSFADKLMCGIFLKFFLPVACDDKTILFYTVIFFPSTTIILGLLFVWLRALNKNKNEKILYDQMKNEIDENVRETMQNKFNNTNNILEHSRLTFITNYNRKGSENMFIDGKKIDVNFPHNKNSFNENSSIEN